MGDALQWLRRWPSRAGAAWTRANNTARATVAGILVLVLVGGTVLAVNEDAQRAFTEATGLSVVAGSPVISTETGEPAVFEVSGHKEFFVRGQDNKLWRRSMDSSGNWSWSVSANAPLAYSAPAVVARGNGFQVFVKGQDGTLWTKYFSEGTFNPWTSLGGLLTSSPSAVWVRETVSVTQSGSPITAPFLVVVVKGGDNGFYLKRMSEAGVWDDYVPLGGVFTSGPAVGLYPQGSLMIAGRGTDNSIWWSFSDSRGRLISWKSLGGVFTSGPAVARVEVSWYLDAYNREDYHQTFVFGRGTDNALWGRRLSSQGPISDWGPWESLGGVFTSGPSLHTYVPTVNDLRIYGRGTDGKIYARTYNATAGNKRYVSTSEGWSGSSWTPLP